MKAVLLLALSSLGVPSWAQTDLGGGTVTRTNVGEYADLALDVRDIRTQTDSNQALALYEQGLHSLRSDGFRQSLQQTNEDVAKADFKTPLYLFHLYGLADRSSNLFVLDSQGAYADAMIKDTIRENLEFADHAVLAMGMWMYATHVLFQGVAVCEERTKADNPDIFPDPFGFDEFIALWIGADQTPGTDQGHSLYAWTQAIGELLDLNSPEHPVNSELRLLYEEGATVLNGAKACTKDNPEAVNNLWALAARMSHAMVRPLFQWLIYFIRKGDLAATKIYATALVPQLSRCKPSVFERLKEALLDNQLNPGTSDSVIADLEESFSCFALTCEDVGVTECDDSRSFPLLASYRPSTSVDALARIDLDIYQLRILSSLQAQTLSRMFFEYGFNSLQESDKGIQLMSLQWMATSDTRRDADPLYTAFVAYHDDHNYAEKVVAASIDGNSPKWVTPAQRTETIALTAAHQIVFMHAVASLNRAVEQCQASDPNVGFLTLESPWDQAAALLIGSMEGENGGDGQLTFQLASDRAFQFGTMTGQKEAVVRSQLEDLLFAGKAELQSLDCDNLALSATRIKQLMTIPIFQSVIASAIAIDKEHPGAGGTTQELAEGEAYALAILPMIATGDELTAEVLAENMIVKAGVDPVRDGPHEVADAVAFAVTKEIGLPCKYLGSTGGVNPCRYYTTPGSSGTMVVPLTALLLLSVSFLV